MIPKKVVLSLALPEALPLSGVQAIEFLLTSYLMARNYSKPACFRSSSSQFPRACLLSLPVCLPFQSPSLMNYSSHCLVILSQYFSINLAYGIIIKLLNFNPLFCKGLLFANNLLDKGESS